MYASTLLDLVNLSASKYVDGRIEWAGDRNWEKTVLEDACRSPMGERRAENDQRERAEDEESEEAAASMQIVVPAQRRVTMIKKYHLQIIICSRAR
ncbi:hypothetical protein J1614_008543 [Plenodomus biglobosus]|nr:hypothetical protein J1614_008543 [Plenodomus biglobosus]